MNTTNLIAKTALIAVLGLVATQSATAEIYKTVDENGNVVFTDKPPQPGAEPIKPRELSVVERPAYAQDSMANAAAEGENEPGLGDMRRMYRNFRMVSPAQDQTFWGTGNLATFAWDVDEDLQEGMYVMTYLNGGNGEKMNGKTMISPRLDRGEHNVFAELRTAEGQLVAKTNPVKFHIKQQSAIGRAGGG